MKQRSDEEVKAVIAKSRKIAKKLYGASDLHPEQRRIIRLLAKGRDTMGILPTSRGKSLVYQAFPKATNTTALIITPLKALMRDQVMRAKQKGYSAAYIASGDSESDDAMEKLDDDQLDLLYVSPERLRGKAFFRICRHADIGLIAIDEAHCIVQWMDKFRPAYGYIGEFIDKLAKARKYRPPVVALTATATPADCRVIAERLHLKPNFKRIVSDPVRDNIEYQVLKNGTSWANVKSRAIQWEGDGYPGSYIVYCASRAVTELVAASLNHGEVVARSYHAGYDEKLRRRIEEDYMAGKYKIIVATNAFGMGIDKPDIREIVHFSAASSIEAYVQESGRAGRDGKPAMATMLCDPKGWAIQKRFVETAVPKDEFLEGAWEYLNRKIADEDQQLETSVFELCEKLKQDIAGITPYDIEPVLLTLDAMGAIRYTNAESSINLQFDWMELKEGLSKLDASSKAVAEAILSLAPAQGLVNVFYDPDNIAEKCGLKTRVVKRAVIVMDKEKDLLSSVRQYNRVLINLKKFGLPAAEVIDYKKKEAYQHRLMKRLEAVVEFATCGGDYKGYIRKYFGYTEEKVPGSK